MCNLSDGARIELTPESSVRNQKLLGADIIIPLDILQSQHVTRADLLATMERTHRFAFQAFIFFSLT